MIADNWPHYVQLHRISNYRFRNDYAMSMALHLVYGHTDHGIPGLPINLATVMPGCSIQRQDQGWVIGYANAQGRAMRLPIKNMDLHITGKKTLQGIIDAD